MSNNLPHSATASSTFDLSAVAPRILAEAIKRTPGIKPEWDSETGTFVFGFCETAEVEDLPRHVADWIAFERRPGIADDRPQIIDRLKASVNEVQHEQRQATMPVEVPSIEAAVAPSASPVIIDTLLSMPCALVFDNPEQKPKLTRSKNYLDPHETDAARARIASMKGKKAPPKPKATEPDLGFFAIDYRVFEGVCEQAHGLAAEGRIRLDKAILIPAVWLVMAQSTTGKSTISTIGARKGGQRLHIPAETFTSIRDILCDEIGVVERVEGDGVDRRASDPYRIKSFAELTGEPDNQTEAARAVTFLPNTFVKDDDNVKGNTPLVRIIQCRSLTGRGAHLNPDRFGSGGVPDIGLLALIIGAYRHRSIDSPANVPPTVISRPYVKSRVGMAGGIEVSRYDATGEVFMDGEHALLEGHRVDAADDPWEALAGRLEALTRLNIAAWRPVLFAEPMAPGMPSRVIHHFGRDELDRVSGLVAKSQAARKRDALIRYHLIPVFDEPNAELRDVLQLVHLPMTEPVWRWTARCQNDREILALTASKLKAIRVDDAPIQRNVAKISLG